MTTQPISDELQAALARLIEGVPESQDDELVANELRAQPELRSQLRDQLVIDALLRLEAEPTETAFVEELVARILPPADEAAFLRRVSAALPLSTGFIGKMPVQIQGWIPSRFLTAAAGLLIGAFFASIVFAYVAPEIVRTMQLMRESFEAGPAPRATGVPLEPGMWSGDYSKIVGKQHEVQPKSGDKMLRFLRADYEGKPQPEGSSISQVYRLIDVRSYRDQFSDGRAVVRFSAELNALAFNSDERYKCSVALYALDAEMAASGLTRNRHLLDLSALAMARNSHLDLDRDPTSWQTLYSELSLPPNIQYLLIRVEIAHATPAQVRMTFDGHYLDDVSLVVARGVRKL